MTAALIVYALIAGALVAAAALLADNIQHRRGAARRWTWMASLLVVCVLVVAAPFQNNSIDDRATSAADDAGLTATSTTAAIDASRQPRAVVVFHLFTDAVHRITARTARALGAALGPGVESSLRLALFVMSGLALLISAGAYLAFGLLRRKLPRQDLLGTTVRVAPRIGPAVIGIYQPEIIVPRWLIGRSAEEQRIVLSHEAEHILAGDQVLLAIAALAIVLLPWHPAVWWMAAKLRLAIEIDCDQRVISRGIAPARYGTVLIDLAEQCSGISLGLAGLADRRSHLEWRVRTMTEIRKQIGLPRIAASACIAAALILVACNMDVPTDVAGADASAAETAARRAGLISATGNVVYTVDGKPMSPEKAKAIAPEDIASISVLRAPAKGAGQIVILTRQGKAASGSVSTMEVPTSGAEVAERDAVLRLLDFSGIVQPDGPLFVVDGVPSSKNAFTKIDQGKILSIEVIKGSRAASLSTDPRAAKGLILIKMHK
jgi:hypothetical protein